MKWPDKQNIDASIRAWIRTEKGRRSDLCRAGYFGSYARGDWSVGSDVDIVVIVANSKLPFERRSIDWDTKSIPVPVELLVYTKEEWQRLMSSGNRFAKTLETEMVWVLPEIKNPR